MFGLRYRFISTTMTLKTCLVFITVAAAVNGETRQFRKITGKVILNNSYNETMDSALNCCAVCSSDSNCAAVSYSGQHRVCSLNYNLEHIFNIESAWESYEFIPCSSGWILYNQYCYLVVTALKSWLEAENHCQSKTSHLVDIQDVNEGTFVFNNVQSAVGSSRYWFGLNDREVDETYVYTSGAQVIYAHYADGEPSVSAGGSGVTWEHCMEVLENGKWNDEECNKNSYSVCKKGAILT